MEWYEIKMLLSFSTSINHDQPPLPVSTCLLRAGCANLPLGDGSKPPTTLVRVKSYAKHSDKVPLQEEMFKTEVIEVGGVN